MADRGKPETRGGRTIADIAAVMRDPSFTADEARLWTLYRSYDTRGKGAWPGDETLATHMNVSQRKVQRVRAKLLARGYLKQKRRGPGRPAIYWAVIPDAVAAILEADPHRNGKGPIPWQCFGVDSPEEIVRNLELMIRIYDKDGMDGVPDEMWDQWGDIWDSLRWPRLKTALDGHPDTKRGRAMAWTAWRHEVHRQLPNIVRERAAAE